MAPAASKLARTGSSPICDRLSALPNDLLRRVLSSLRAPEVVRTTILSKRWKNLWRSVPDINIDFRDFFRDPSEPNPWSASWFRMENFVSNMLSEHESRRLDTFRLTAHNSGHDSCGHFDLWIRSAIFGDPLVLEVWMLGFNGQYPLSYPRSSSSCRRLKNLKLSGVELDQSFAEGLHSWWPQLEDLDLTRCHLGFSGIESDILRNLAIVYCESADGFVIRAPGLATLKLAICSESDGYRNGITLYLGNSPLTASIELKRGKFSPRCEGMILGSLSNVTSLEMKNFQALAILGKDLCEKFPRSFNNMRTLTLNSFCQINYGIHDVDNFKPLGRILQTSPKIEKLTLEYFKMTTLVVEPVEYHTLENLRTLFLDNCTFSGNFESLHHYLRNSPNLEKLAFKECKVSNGSTARKGKDKSEKTYSRNNMVTLHCPKLRSTELIYYGRRNAGILAVQMFLQDISAPNNSIKFTNAKYYR